LTIFYVKFLIFFFYSFAVYFFSFNFNYLFLNQPGPKRRLTIRRASRGIQYAAAPYRLALARSAITPSMSRKGDCLDNAPMESFFHSLKTQRVHHRIYDTRAEARRDLFQYIEGFYNSRRLHSALGYISPAFAERMAA